MALSPLIQNKLKQYYLHSIKALNFFYQKDYESALTDFRKSAEAFMKILILKSYGDPNGDKVIKGELDEFLVARSPANKLEYHELLSVVKNRSLLQAGEFSRLKDIQSKTGNAAHNPNIPVDFKPDAELCKTQSYQLSESIYKRLNEPYPGNLVNAYNGPLSSATLQGLEISPWDDILNYTDNFSTQNKYILISPSNFGQINGSQLEILSRVHWSMILDFDSNTKETGLFNAFDQTVGSQTIIPLNIKQEGQKGLVNVGNYPTINWVFANGLSSMPTTITSSVRNWKNQKYHRFIKILLKDFFSKEVCRYFVVYLCDDLSFPEEVVRVISDNEEIPKDLVNHLFITSNQATFEEIENYDTEFDVNYKLINLSFQGFLSELSGLLPQSSAETEKILVPARTVAEQNDIIDISDIYQKLIEENIQVVYQNIDRISPGNVSSNIPAFYQGELITWYELATQIHATRHRTTEILIQLRSHLTTLKKAFKFNLYHKPGAGGTTLSRTIAFELRKEFPTAILTGFDKAKTYNNLRLFLQRVNRPALVIVEGTDISVNELDELIASCNTNKIVAGFIHVKRSLKAESFGEFAAFISDTMMDVEEFERFYSKAEIYASDKASLINLKDRSGPACEVIDFSLSINETGYNKNKLAQYISAYIEKLQDDFSKFTVYSSLVYYYSQRPLSELIFRSLFKKSLSAELRQIAVPNQFIRKILLQEYNQKNYNYTENWRPRYSKFAGLVLSKVLGDGKQENWKDLLDIYSLDFIKDFKSNNEYLTKETLNILRGMFLERNNEDLLGIEEQWRSAVDNDQFSYLLRDIGDKQKQKSVLKALVDAYPNESHFLGHMARFIYEKAEHEQEFQDAEYYVTQAIENDGEDDFNLQHIGGMCKRRQLEFIKRNYQKSDSMDNLEPKIQELAEQANAYFNESLRINPYNIHAYVAQVQTLILAIDFGKEISKTEKVVNFINADSNIWYLEQYNKVLQLIQQAQMLLEQQESRSITTKTKKSKSYISKAEGNAFEILGDYKSSAALFKDKSEASDRQFRPAFRNMYIQSLLLGKVAGNRNRLDYAWGKLKDDEIYEVQNVIDKNFLQDPGNLANYRLWFKMARYGRLDLPIDDIIARVKLFYEKSENSKIAQLEASFYLFVLNALVSIQVGEQVNPTYKKSAEQFLEICKDLSQNPKFTYEYLVVGDGIENLANYKYRPTDEESFQRIDGVISKISSRQQGWINLSSGLEVFFVPHIGTFIEGKEESTPVSFQLGFRHEGMVAIDVRRKSDHARKQVSTTDQIKDEELVDDLLEEVVEEINLSPAELAPLSEMTEEKDKPDQDLFAKPKLPGLKEVGKKIDVSQFENPKRREIFNK